MKKLLITGAGGFVGTNLIRKAFYNKLPVEIAGLDSYLNEEAKKNHYVHKSLSFHIADVNNIDVFSNILDLEKPEYILHLASSKEKYSSIDDLIALDSVIKGIKDFSINGTEVKTRPHLFLLHSKFYTPVEEMEKILIKNSFIDFTIIHVPDLFGTRQDPNNFIPMLVHHIYDEFSEMKPKYSTSSLEQVFPMQMRSLMWIQDFTRHFYQFLETGIFPEAVYFKDSYSLYNAELANQIQKIIEEGAKGGPVKLSTVRLCSKPDLKEASEYFTPLFEKKFMEDLIPLKENAPITSALSETVNWYIKNFWFFK